MGSTIEKSEGGRFKVITDNQANFLWLSDLLPNYKSFFERFTSALSQQNIKWALLPGTKDIWARDYMPIQIAPNKFVQFKYQPDYLQSIKWKKTISNPEEICKTIGISAIQSDLVVDGGNIVRFKNTAIMCDKVFFENKTIPKKSLTTQLMDALEVEKLVFIPWDKKQDFTGHVDGIVRFITSDKVLINNHSKTDSEYAQLLKVALLKAGLNYLELPYNPYQNKTNDQANGIYLNYLQMQDVVFLPIFGLKEDEEAIRKMQQLYKTVVPVMSNEIAEQGGVLNCITWPVYK